MRFTIIISLFLVFAACKTNTFLANIENNSVRMDENIGEDSAMAQLIQPYKEKLDSKMNVKIGEIAKPLNLEKPESLLGNWVADALHVQCEQYYEQKIDFTYTNYGGLRIPALYQGDVTIGNVFELMPFDNMMVVVEIGYDDLMKLVDYFATKGGEPVSHHFHMRIKNGKPTNVTINGQPIDKNKTYKIATTDYIANGGDNLVFLKKLPSAHLQKYFRDALIEYIKAETIKGNRIDAQLDGRVKMDSGL
jgi:2',3'-cyclic-nucleotide 2'-phosphodiesterase (5'-nucleotidase family)